MIWGVGRRTERYMDFGYFDRCEIVKYIDTNKGGTTWNEVEVIFPEQVIQYINDIDYIVISTQFFGDVYAQCCKFKIDVEKLVFTDYIEEKFMRQNFKVIRDISEKLYEDVRMRKYRFMVENEKDDYDNSRLIGQGQFDSEEYWHDYYRYRTFEFVANEIKNGKVVGSVAELGVFRGTFSAFINECFADRKMYLFDTFEGFDREEELKEREQGNSTEEFDYAHKKTSIDIILNRMPNKERCVICKGLFPGTVTSSIEQERFAFVSIDVDFEKSIYEGLKFFYPRLSDGGYIFIHDYNSAFLSGVRAAVEKYEEVSGECLKKVPIADRAGTLVIVK